MGLKQHLTAERAQHAVAQASLEAATRRAAELADDARILRRQVRALNKAKAAVVEERCACADVLSMQEPPCSWEAACSVLNGLGAQGSAACERHHGNAASGIDFAICGHVAGSSPLLLCARLHRRGSEQASRQDLTAALQGQLAAEGRARRGHPGRCHPAGGSAAGRCGHRGCRCRSWRR